MSTSTVDRKHAFAILSIIIASLVLHVITNFNWIDFGYLLFVISCIIRYLYICRNE